MGNHDNGLRYQLALEFINEYFFAIDIHCTGRLIHQQNGRSIDERSSNGNGLFLATG